MEDTCGYKTLNFIILFIACWTWLDIIVLSKLHIRSRVAFPSQIITITCSLMVISHLPSQLTDDMDRVLSDNANGMVLDLILSVHLFRLGFEVARTDVDLKTVMTMFLLGLIQFIFISCVIIALLIRFRTGRISHFLFYACTLICTQPVRLTVHNRYDNYSFCYSRIKTSLSITLFNCLGQLMIPNFASSHLTFTGLNDTVFMIICGIISWGMIEAAQYVIRGYGSTKLPAAIMVATMLFSIGIGFVFQIINNLGILCCVISITRQKIAHPLVIECQNKIWQVTSSLTSHLMLLVLCLKIVRYSSEIFHLLPEAAVQTCLIYLTFFMSQMMISVLVSLVFTEHKKLKHMGNFLPWVLSLSFNEVPSELAIVLTIKTTIFFRLCNIPSSKEYETLSLIHVYTILHYGPMLNLYVMRYINRLVPYITQNHLEGNRMREKCKQVLSGAYDIIMEDINTYTVFAIGCRSNIRAMNRKIMDEVSRRLGADKFQTCTKSETSRQSSKVINQNRLRSFMNLVLQRSTNCLQCMYMPIQFWKYIGPAYAINPSIKIAELHNTVTRHLVNRILSGTCPACFSCQSIVKILLTLPFIHLIKIEVGLRALVIYIRIWLIFKRKTTNFHGSPLLILHILRTPISYLKWANIKPSHRLIVSIEQVHSVVEYFDISMRMGLWTSPSLSEVCKVTSVTNYVTLATGSIVFAIVFSLFMLTSLIDEYQICLQRLFELTHRVHSYYRNLIVAEKQKSGQIPSNLLPLIEKEYKDVNELIKPMYNSGGINQAMTRWQVAQDRLLINMTRFLQRMYDDVLIDFEEREFLELQCYHTLSPREMVAYDQYQCLETVFHASNHSMWFLNTQPNHRASCFLNDQVFKQATRVRISASQPVKTGDYYVVMNGRCVENCSGAFEEKDGEHTLDECAQERDIDRVEINSELDIVRLINATGTHTINVIRSFILGRSRTFAVEFPMDVHDHSGGISQRREKTAALSLIASKYERKCRFSLVGMVSDMSKKSMTCCVKSDTDADLLQIPEQLMRQILQHEDVNRAARLQYCTEMLFHVLLKPDNQFIIDTMMATKQASKSKLENIAEILKNICYFKPISRSFVLNTHAFLIHGRLTSSTDGRQYVGPMFMERQERSTIMAMISSSADILMFVNSGCSCEKNIYRNYRLQSRVVDRCIRSVCENANKTHIMTKLVRHVQTKVQRTMETMNGKLLYQDGKIVRFQNDELEKFLFHRFDEDPLLVTLPR